MKSTNQGLGIRGFQAVVLGASAGAVAALAQLLPSLPGEYPLPIVIVVHQPAGKPSALPSLFQSMCRIRVKEAEDKESLVGGTAYIAPPDYHLLMEADRTLSLSADEPVNFSRPAIDVLFESAADVYGMALLGVILTGANTDGARGARAICDAGGNVVVQCPDSAEERAMPEGALGSCERAVALSLQGILEVLLTAKS